MIKTLGVGAAGLAVITGCSASSGSAPTFEESTHPAYVLSGGCDNERSAVRNGTADHTRTADVDGDGMPDTVYVVADRTAPKDCRTFVVVDTGDVTYSANATVLGYRDVAPAAVFRLTDLGGSPGVEIVTRQVAFGIESLTVHKLFTFFDGRLTSVVGPYRDVVDDPFGLPLGVGCTADGRIVISGASDLDPTVTRTVDRRFFTLVDDRLTPAGEEIGEVPGGESLAQAFPEFEHPLFSGC
jgi:hypothetical protein